MTATTRTRPRTTLKPPHAHPDSYATHALDTAVCRVGDDFPSIGAFVRLGWVSGA